MNKLRFLLLPALILCATANAAYAEDTQQEFGWSAVLKKVGLEFTSTEVKNSEEYADSPNAELSGDSETVTKGILDFSLIDQQEKFKWENNIFAEYGKTKLRPKEGPNVTNETADKILLSTDFAHKTWQRWDAYIGPFINMAYQTEFEKNENAPRTEIIRGMTGLKLFDGKYIESLYGAVVGEYDFTYHHDKTTKLAYEIGLKAAYNLREGIDFNLDTYFRDYLKYSSYNPHDFEYEYSLKGNMMVDVYNGFKMGPYIQYFRAQDRGSRKYGSSTIIGVEASFGGDWKL